MIDVVSFLPGKQKQTASGWISFNAPCCTHRGDTQDKRQRGGIKPGTDSSWSYHCFNCGYTASFVLGRNLTFKARKLLEWLNVPTEEIERINLESLRHRNIEGILNDRQQAVRPVEIQFEECDLPADTEELTDAARDYLTNRGIMLDYPYLSKRGARSGIVVPFTHNGQIVGHTTRFLDDRIPKYIQHIPPGYVFGTDLQQNNWQSVIVTEGVFDALSINGVAVLHADINDAQARLVRSLEREIVVVPDQDLPGMRLVERAVELGWSVSMPEWPLGVKDVNDAVICMGRLATLLTIMQARETSKIKIELRKKQLNAKIKNKN